MIELGVISDTHGLVRPEAINALNGCDMILHAGDIGRPEVLTELEKLAPVKAVRGNVDKGDWVGEVPDTVRCQIGGVWIYLIHNVKELALCPSDVCQILIFGHSHKPSEEMREGVLFFNPGSAGPRRFRLPVTLGRIRIEQQQFSTRILNLLK